MKYFTWIAAMVLIAIALLGLLGMIELLYVTIEDWVNKLRWKRRK